MCQTFLPNYWAVSRAGEWVHRYILKSYFSKISNFLDNQHQATISMSCFINNQYHNVQGCIFFCIFVTLRQRQMNILDITWAKNQHTQNLSCKSGIKTPLQNAGNVPLPQHERDTNPHRKQKKWHWRKHTTAHPTEFWTVPHLINQIRPTQGVKQQIFRKIQTHGRRDSISVSTQMKL